MSDLKRFIPLTEEGYQKLRGVLLSKDNISKKHFRINGEPVIISERSIVQKLKESPNPIYCSISDIKNVVHYLREFGLMEKKGYMPIGTGSMSELEKAFKEWGEELISRIEKDSNL